MSLHVADGSSKQHTCTRTKLDPTSVRMWWNGLSMYGGGTSAAWQAFKTCMRREVTLTIRNAFVYEFRTFQTAVLSLISCTLFFRTRLQRNLEDANLYEGFLFFALLVMLFNGLSEMTFTVIPAAMCHHASACHLLPTSACGNAALACHMHVCQCCQIMITSQ